MGNKHLKADLPRPKYHKRISADQDVMSWLGQVKAYCTLGGFDPTTWAAIAAGLFDDTPLRYWQAHVTTASADNTCRNLFLGELQTMV